MTDEQLLQSDGPAGRIGYRRTGSGPALILLHPLALSGAVWDRLAAELSRDFDVIRPDARGHGVSGWDGNEFSVNDMAADVVALLDALDLPSSHLLGMSMGGSVAIAAAGLYPDRVDRMILADTTAWYGADAPTVWAQRARQALARSRRQQIPFQTDRWFTDFFRHHYQDEVRRVVNVFLATDSAAHAAASQALGKMDSRSLLATITAPTLVLTGQEDYATPPSMGRLMAESIPEAAFMLLPRLRHLSLVEQPRLAEVIRAHLAGAPLPAALPISSCGCMATEHSVAGGP